MEELPRDKILTYNPDTLKAVRYEFNLENPGRLEEAINILEDWIKKQDHFVKKDFDREYLERTIVTTKGLVERAKARMDKLCTFKTLLPNFFQILEEKRHQSIAEKLSHAHLPKLTDDHYRVYVLKIHSDEVTASDIFDYYRNLIIISEYMKAHDYCNGFILVLDYRDTNVMSLATKLNPSDLRQALAVMMDGYGMRVKGIHMITPSKMVDALVTVFKQVLSAKVASRIHVHKSVETLYDYVPKSMLPSEFDGDGKSLRELHQQWIEVITSEEFTQYLKEMNTATTNEAYRQTDKFNEQYLGMPGSFRTLSVD
ncbi:alpha-tocopherol transfer protein [Manduca sexta]